MFLLDSVQLTCGTSEFTIAAKLLELITLIVNVIKIGIPVLLIIFGMLDLGKAVIAQKEDEIKKGQQLFVKRLVSAVLVFLVVFIVQIVIGLVASDNDEQTNIFNCVDCFINYDDVNGCDGGTIIRD